MTEVRDAPEAQRPHVTPTVLGLAALSALAQGLNEHVLALRLFTLAVAAGCLSGSFMALRGRRIGSGLKIGIAAASLVFLVIQLAIALLGRRIGSGAAWEVAVAAGWAPFPLIMMWLLFERAAHRRAAVSAYYVALVLPAVAFGIGRGPAAAPGALSLGASLVLAGAAATIVLAELTRLHETFAVSWAAREALERMAHTDPLTELPNRRSLMTDLTREAAVAARFGLALAVIEFDLDHFKEVNDVYGHQAGDQVLVAVARHVQRRLRATDVVGRLGGEEFLILAPGNTIAEATDLAEEICRSLHERPMAGDRGWVTGSFGVTAYEPGDTADAILARADAALYTAKRGGRNRVAMLSRGTSLDRATHTGDGAADAASLKRG